MLTPNGFGIITYLQAVAAQPPPGHLCVALLGKAAATMEPDASKNPLEASAAHPSPLLRE